jgi:hypothetical protein
VSKLLTKFGGGLCKQADGLSRVLGGQQRASYLAGGRLDSGQRIQGLAVRGDQASTVGTLPAGGVVVAGRSTSA